MGEGVVDVHAMRVARLRGEVELSPGRVSMDMSPRESVGVLLSLVSHQYACCVAERRTTTGGE